MALRKRLKLSSNTPDKISLKCQCYSERECFDFEVRSVIFKNRYNFGSVQSLSMRDVNQPINIEDDQRFDSDLLKRLAKIVEILQNIED
jgi:hypothetical protein